MSNLPRLLITMGDVAGVGPEIIARGWAHLPEYCRPLVIGDPEWMRWAVRLIGAAATVEEVRDIGEARPSPSVIPCFLPKTAPLAEVRIGQVCAAAGRAAFDFLCFAIDEAVSGRADGIVTAPLHKAGLRAAGLHYPGHTEILAERTGSPRFAMMLHAHGIGVAHVTLHTSLKSVFDSITIEAIREKIDLLQSTMTKLVGRKPRLAVAALNPHASDDGLFGDEEECIIAPAVRQAREVGIDVTGPVSCDTLFVRARRGEFDGVVAMYHDQGHIALKLLGEFEAVNITLGLPIVRTSVAHGTAYDIAGRGTADATSLIQAVKAAARLAIAR